MSPENYAMSWEREMLLEALDGFQRGQAEPPIIRKWHEAGATSAGADQGRPLTFVISTEDVDRHGDVVVAEGWQLEAYRRNPVFLWAHDYTRPVIGRAVEIWTEPRRLVAQMEFAPTEFAQEVANLYRDGYQRGVSVGFKPIRYEERRHEKTGAFLGIRFLEQELLEASAVPVPANRSALRRALDQSPRLGEYLRRVDASSPSRRSGTGSITSVLDAMWPELSARVDELTKLVEELAQMVSQVESAGRHEPHREELSTVLAALGHARW